MAVCSNSPFHRGSKRLQDLTSARFVLLPELSAAERSVREVLRTRGFALLRVSGGSMGPWLHPGDLVVVGRSRAKQLSAGRIIVFARDGRLVIHRIIRRETKAGKCVFLTKGDAVPRPDAFVDDAELLGEVLSIERRGISLDLRTPGRLVWGRVLSKLSLSSRFWQPGVRLTRRLFSRVL